MGELAAVRVQREQAAECDVLAAVEEILCLADTAETQRLDPREAIKGEAVVELGDIDVGGAQRGAGPQVRGLTEDLRFVGQGALIPLEPLDDLRAAGLDKNGRIRQSPGRIDCWHN